MAKHYIEKNGWHVNVVNGYPAWIETNSTYNTLCTVCGGSGKGSHDRNCDCEGLDWNCKNYEPCWKCGGKGKLKDVPKFPQPDNIIVHKLSLELQEVFKSFGKRLDDGSLEVEIEKERAVDGSLNSCSL